MSELIPVTIYKIMQSKSYTLFIMSAQDKKFAIYTAPSVGVSIQACAIERGKLRPHTHDLITAMAEGLNAAIPQIVIYDVQDTVYFAKIYLEQLVGDQRNVLEIDARPSDCFTLALMKNIPLFCDRTLLDRIVPIEE